MSPRTEFSPKPAQTEAPRGQASSGRVDQSPKVGGTVTERLVSPNGTGAPLELATFDVTKAGEPRLEPQTPRQKPGGLEVFSIDSLQTDAKADKQGGDTNGRSHGYNNCC